MGRLIYAAIASLDGYVADADGRFDWAAPDEAVHAAVNDLQRRAGTLLLGRRMYEVLVAWETMPTAGEPAVIRDFAEIWHDSDKVVYSTTLDAVASTRTSIERAFDADAVRRRKRSSARDIAIGGPELAAQAFAARLVDECHLFVVPIVVGAGHAALPRDVRVRLNLLEARRFASGVVQLYYEVDGAA